MDVTKFYSAASGGVRTYLDAKMRALADRDVEHTVVVPGEEDGTTEMHRTKLFRIAGPVISFSPNYRLMVRQCELERIIRAERPHVIEVGSPFLVPVLVRRAVSGLSIRTVGFYHSDLVRTYAEPLVRHRLTSPVRVATRNLARRFVRNVYRRFDATVAASRTVSSELRALGVPHVHTVSLGVDLATFTPSVEPSDLRRRLGVPAGTPIGLFVGRFCMEKRLEVVLEAHGQLPAPDRPHLVFVGGGALEARFSEESARRHDFSILPFVNDHHELARLYRAADFYLAAGPGETFGLAIAEAMASGLPVLCVDSGAAPDRVRGSGAFELYRHGDSADCARAMTRLQRRLSPALRNAARLHAERSFGWDRTFDALLDVYSSLVPELAR
jgi:alpha-1,6-mannosyltransferase